MTVKGESFTEKHILICNFKKWCSEPSHEHHPPKRIPGIWNFGLVRVKEDIQKPIRNFKDMIDSINRPRAKPVWTKTFSFFFQPFWNKHTYKLHFFSSALLNYIPLRPWETALLFIWNWDYLFKCLAHSLIPYPMDKWSTLAQTVSERGDFEGSNRSKSDINCVSRRRIFSLTQFETTLITIYNYFYDDDLI